MNIRSLRKFSLALLLLAVIAGNASAIVVSGKENIEDWPETPVPQYPWDNAVDIPYDNIGKIAGCGGIYLGNGWVLTAKHAATGAITLNDVTYNYDADSIHYLENPTDVPGLESTYADLQLYRLTEEPDLPAVKIATEPPAIEATVYYVGFGGKQSEQISYWDLVVNGSTYEWIQGDSDSDYWGYITGSSEKNWGRSRVASGLNGPTSGTGVIGVNGTYSITIKTIFNSLNEVAQATSGDSGGSTFYQDANGDWVLGGIISCVEYPQDAPTQAIYGATTHSVALAYYQEQILNIITPELIPGDANGDGIVDGSDVTILAAHWQQSTDLGAKFGDFNGDGIVDGSDLTILAGNWQYNVDSQESFAVALTAAFGGGAVVPEPSVLMLLGGLISLFCGRLKLRRCFHGFRP